MITRTMNTPAPAMNGMGPGRRWRAGGIGGPSQGPAGGRPRQPEQVKGGLSMTMESVAVSSDPAPTQGGRIVSVDVLRGLTILLMIFVNDLGRAAPSWMHHIQPPNADGMTLADVVFPAFLFIVGVSIPLAFERARAAGKTTWAQFGHILIRTAGLLFMGVIVYNSEDSQTRGQPLWGVLAFSR